MLYKTSRIPVAMKAINVGVCDAEADGLKLWVRVILAMAYSPSMLSPVSNLYRNLFSRFLCVSPLYGAFSKTGKFPKDRPYGQTGDTQSQRDFKRAKSATNAVQGDKRHTQRESYNLKARPKRSFQSTQELREISVPKGF